jgi:hypothetical protein
MEELLARFGFRFDRHGKSGYDLWAPRLPGRPVPIPRNKRAIPGGTVQAILREAGITRAKAFAFWGLH